MACWGNKKPKNIDRQRNFKNYPICKKGRHVSNFMKNHKGQIIDNVGKYDVMSCTLCGFIHLSPIPTKESINELYKTEYYSHKRPLYIKRNLEDERWWRTVFEDRLQTITEYKRSGGKRLIELGSGPGLFLKYAKKNGWSVLGIEPSSIASKFSRHSQVKVLEVLFEDLDLESVGVFDSVVMFEVLEHLSNPRETLTIANQLLKGGGIVCISVPNDYNPFQKIARRALKMKPYWLAPPLHINYFTTESIVKLLRRCGFEVVYMETNFPMEMFLLFGDKYVGNDKLGRNMHSKRKKFDVILSQYNNGLKRELYKNLASMEIGRNITIYGKKI